MSEVTKLPMKFEPTDMERKLVGECASVGLPQDSIALLVRDGVDPKTLRKYFRRELDHGKAAANLAVGTTLYTKAVQGDTACAIFWAKTQMGWRETTKVDLGGDVNISVRLNGIAPKND